MTDLDYYNYQHDMQESAEADFDMWVWCQECDYYAIVIFILTLFECDEYEGMPF